MAIGTGFGSKGTLTVTGSGSRFIGQEVQVGRGTGVATIDVRDGGTATVTGSLFLGHDNGSNGTATVSGTGSSLVMTGTVFVGGNINATGTLTISDGATATVGTGAGTLPLGGDSNARGFLTIGAAPGSAAVAPGTLNAAAVSSRFGSAINFNHTSAAYTFVPQINGGAAVRVFNGTTTLTAANTYTGGTVLNGGTLAVAADTALGDAAGGLSFDGGTLRVTGTGFTSTPRTITWGAGGGGFDIADPANSFTVGQVLVLSSTGGLVKQGPGTLVLTGANTYGGGTTISAGTLQLGNGGATGSIIGNVINNGVLAINRDTVSLGGVISGSGALHQAGPGNTILTADNTYTGGTTISAGELQLGGGGATGSIIGNVINNGGLGVSRTGTLVLDGVISGTGSLFLDGAGGTTILTAANTYSGGTLILGGDTLQLGNGGATGSITGAIGIEGTLAINRSDVYIVDNVIVSNGALRQIGTGTTVLTANNSAFNGTATVASGTLRVDSKLGTGPVSVQSGGTLGGIGTIGGAVTVADGGTLLGTQGQTLTMGRLVLSATSNVNVALGAPGTTRLFNVTGNLTLDGRLNITDAGGFGPGVYRLIDYSGTLTDNGLAIGSVPGGVNASDLLVQTSFANQVNLVNRTGVSLNFWDGDAPANQNNNSIDGGNGTWTATSGNWTIPSGASNGPMRPQPGFAIFQGAPGTVTVDNSAGAVAVTGMQFAVNGYRVQGGAITLADPQSIIRVGDGSAAGAEMAATIAAPLAGSGGLVKSDLGTLVLTAANTYTGATTVSAGTLRIGAGGSIASSSAVTLSAAGATLNIAAAGNSFVRNLAGVAGTSVVLGGNLVITSTTDTTFAGIFSGGGVLFKDGAATLTLTGANTHTAVTNITAGTLALGPGGSIAQSAGVSVRAGATFDITAAGNQTLQSLSGNAGGTVVLGANTLTVNTANSIFSGVITGSGGLVRTGTGTQALGGTNTYTGATTIAGGTLLLTGSDAIATSSSVTLSASGATLALGTDQTVQNLGGVSGSIVTLGANTLTVASSTDTIFAGAIGGTGGLVKAGTGTLTFTGTSTYNGATTLTAGRLTVNGSIASSIVSVTAGTLAGTGTVGGIVATGGTVAPGNSIGTLNVAGNVSFAPGSTYEVEIEPAGTSDRLHATGTATLTGGTVSVIKATGSYTAGTRYTIVTADAGVTGTFNGFTQNLPFIDLALAYDPTNVYLDVARNAVTFCSLAGSANQCAAANGAESLGAGNALFDAIASLPDAASARQAFNALSGEVHASTRSALIEDSHYLRDAVVARTRLSGLSSTGAAPQFAALAQATDQSQRPQDGTAITAWFQGFGAIARTSGDGNAASARRTTGGFFVGADTKIADTWTVGIATGYSRTTLDINGRSSRADIDSYHLALYGGAQFGPIGLRLGASHTWHSIDSSRSIAFPGFADAARADYKARTTQLFGDVGYALALGDVAVEPFANLAWVHLSTNRFGERGGVAALRARGGTDSNLFSTLGIRAAAQVWNDDNKTLTLRGTLGWRHAFGDVTPAARLAFAGGASFGVEGVPIARNAVVVEAGFDLKVGKAFTVGAGYSGVLASGAHDHAFKGNLTYRF